MREVDSILRVSVSRPYCFTTPTTPTMVYGLLGIEPDVLADGVAGGQKRCANLLVDDRHLLAIGRIVLREEPALA